MARPIDGLLSCPAPLPHGDIVQLAHGGGGTLTARLIETLFAPAFDNPHLEPLGDGAVLTVGGERLAFTTDSFVVKPVFFPGGDIGSLAVHGTVNDLAMCGAEPLFLSAGLVLEEGFPMSDLERVVAGMAGACRGAGVALVTGDTKVVDRGKGDGIYVNTSGLGRVRNGVHVGPTRAVAGDAVLVSGPVGDHGIAVMAAREGIDFETSLVSDSAPVIAPVRALLDAVPGTHVLRDPTRGGLATALAEIAVSSKVGIQLEEAKIPVRDEVGGACELLGFDPLYVACEGRFLAVVPGEEADAALAAVRSQAGGEDVRLIGRVVAEEPGRVILKTRIGSHRLLERLSGEQLPRIC
ncbi:MAG: hydrogenase expression/formation protein HypE [Acidobacteria bacterium]|jgi:hydrogenase expression/formation protein HypE|nr:hydrogenase expression/formation protein HypE [Acidobacteriota bacterium]